LKDNQYYIVYILPQGIEQIALAMLINLCGKSYKYYIRKYRTCHTFNIDLQYHAWIHRDLNIFPKLKMQKVAVVYT